MKAKLYGLWCFCSILVVALIVITIMSVKEMMSEGWDNALLVLLVLDWALTLFVSWSIWRKVAIGWAYVLARDDFYERAGRIFLWGYPLSEMIQQELPRRLGKYYGSGKCHEFAAVSMYALKDVKTARLCHGIDPEHGRHSWVEYYKYGVWWVVDLAWAYQECVPWPRFICRKNLDLKVESVCKYREFWQGPFAKAIDVLTDPEHELQDSLLVDFLPVFWPVFGYGMKAPDEDEKIYPIKEYEAIKPTEPVGDDIMSNLKDRVFIAKFMDDPSFYSLDDSDDTAT